MRRLVRSLPLTTLSLATLFLFLILSGCSRARHPRSNAGSARQRPSTADVTRPPLTVLVIYDQLGSWMLERHWNALDPNGAIKQTASLGCHVRRARYGYAGTFTAPGHASIATGVDPYRHGISANRVWNSSRGRRVSIMDDGVHPTFGRQDAFASPSPLQVPTVADSLRTTFPEAQIVSISFKDRSAILPGGRSANLALWFDERAGGFTTSTHYGPTLPSWVSDFNRRHPLETLYRSEWTAPPSALVMDLGPDSRSGEGEYGFDDSFPHSLIGLEDHEGFLAMPQSAELLVDLARRATSQFGLGADDTPDFLSISVSTTDYTGHGFGPDSWEYRDVLVKADQYVGAFLSELRRRFPIAVLITSDHGVAPLVERAEEEGHHGVRIASETAIADLERHLDQRVGAGDWIAGWAQPYVYLNPNLSETPRQRALDFALTWLNAQPGVFRAVARTSAPALRSSVDPILNAIGRSIPPRATGDIFVVPMPYSVSAEEASVGRGTSHGSPWTYDTDVPVLFSSPRLTVSGRSIEGATDQLRVAATLADLMSVPVPNSDQRESFQHACQD